MIALHQTIWLVGRHKSGDWPDVVWDVQGAFATEDEAVAACRDQSYFIGPVTVGEVLPHETTEWDGAYWPLWPTSESDQSHA